MIDRISGNNVSSRDVRASTRVFSELIWDRRGI